MDISEKLKRCRTDKSLTQAQVAENYTFHEKQSLVGKTAVVIRISIAL